MIVTRIDTGGVPPAERFDLWLDLMTSAHVPSWVDSEHRSDFRASAAVVDLGGVQVSTMTYPSLRVNRTARLIRRADPEVYQLHLFHDGATGVAQGNRRAAPGAADFVLLDSSRPFLGWRSCGDGTGSGVFVQFPRSLLRTLGPRVDRLLAVPFAARTGIAAVLGDHLRGVVRHAGGYTPADTASLGGVTLDLITAVIGHQVAADTGPAALLVRIRHFIRRHLGDPTLGPATIAAAHQISTRYLHRLFQADGVTVAAWIRDQRLELCRRDLADPAQRDRPIRAIAARRGLPDPGHFSRLFRAAYGRSPSDHRRSCADVPVLDARIQGSARPAPGRL